MKANITLLHTGQLSATYLTRRLKPVFLYMLGFLSMSTLFAQTPPTLQWEANYGSNSNDGASNILATSDGGYLVVGEVNANTGNVTGSGYSGNSDGWVIKLNSSGAIVWKKAYGTSSSDGAINQAIEVTDGYVLVGNRYFSGGVSVQKMWYAKVSKTDGSIVWSQTYSGTFYSAGYSIASTSDGGFLVGGEWYDNEYKALLLRTNSTGVITTTYSSHPSGGIWGISITQIEKTPDNGFLLYGSENDPGEPGCNPGSEVEDRFDVWMCKLTSGFGFSWSKTYGGTTSDYPRDVVVTTAGEIYALGHTACSGTVTGPNGVGEGDWIIHTNSAGTLQESILVSTELSDFTLNFYGLGLSCDNQLLLCGQSGGLLGTSAVLSKMTLGFSHTWTFYSDPSIDITRAAYDVVSNSNNSYTLVGYHYSSSKQGDYYIARLTPDPGCSGSTTTFCDKAVTVTAGQYLANQSITASETNSISTYPCISGSFPGKDKVYKIVLSQAADLQVGLEILTAGVDLDLFLLSNNCTTINCLDQSTTNNSSTDHEGIVHNLAAGTYYIVVDGVSSTATATFNIDFAIGELNCTSPPTLTCGTPYSSTTTGLTNNVSIYGLAAGIGDDVPNKQIDVMNAGPEKLHRFTLTQSATVTITLSGVPAATDLEIFLLSTCDKDNCIAKSTGPAGQNEVITKQLSAGTYYIAVDGFRNNSGAYTLTVDNCGGCTTPPPTTTNCSIVKCYYSGNGTNLQYTFTASQSIASGYNWKITGSNLSVTGGTGTSYTYTFSNPGSYQVCYPYLLPSGCVEYCCIDVCIANPFNCDASITPTFDANQNGWRFSLSGSGLSNIQWRDDATGQYVGTGAQSSLIPVPVPCNNSTARSISAIYYDGSCYRVCCLRYYPCNPFDCGQISFTYNNALSGYNFQLNATGGLDASTISWKVDSPVSQSLGTGSTQSNLLPLPVNCAEYWISVRYRDAQGNWVVCCIRLYVCNPFTCQDFSYNYVPASNGFQFVLNASGATNISWTVDDAPGGAQNIGNSATSNIYPVPGTCVERTITLRYYLNGRWYICCRRVWLCNPFDCLDFTYAYVPSGNGFQFALNAPGATSVSWTVDDAPGGAQNIGNSATSNIYPVPGTCVERTITVRYFLNGRWYICCRRVWLCNPFDCLDFTYAYVSSGNGFQFALNAPGASSISWTVDDAPGGALNIGNNATSNIYPVPGTCVERTITVRYFLNGRWYICCRRVWLCNPFDCLDFTYNYVASGNGFQFVLNAAGVTNVSWTVDDAPGGAQNIGSGATSSIYPVPGTCVERTITVRYFLNGRWYICCRRVWLCNPFDCLDFTYNYVSSGNGYQFALNAVGATSIGWTVDDAPGGAQNIGSSATSNIYPVPGTCVERTITVRYFLNGRWYICCRRIWLCQPNQCAGEIASSWLPNNQISLAVNAAYDNVGWSLGSGGTLGSGSAITIPNPGANSEVCVSYHGPDNIWRICCKNIGNQPNPATDLTFDLDDNVCGGSNTLVQVPVRVRNFNNITTFQMSVAISNGANAQLESITPGTLPGTGEYPVSNSTTGSLLWFNSTPVTVPDNTVVCTLNIRLLGGSGSTATISFTENPVPVAAEQSISNVLTQVTPLLIGGSVCTSSNVSISGHILREDNMGVGNVKVFLSGSSTQTQTTNSQGLYTFSALPAGGSFVITPVKDTADRNGVNGSDLVAIQRHILGITPLPTAYKRIAADVNSSKSINGSDLVGIQRLILQLDPTLPLNTSWQFVDKNHVFQNPNSPWTPAYPQTLSFSNLTTDVLNADFIGVKIADANVSNNPANLGEENLEDRNGRTVMLETDNQLQITASRKFVMPIRLAASCQLESFQFTLRFDPRLMRLKAVSGGEQIAGFGADNFNANLTDDGYLLLVWATPNGHPVQLESGDILLWLEWESSETQTTVPGTHDLVWLDGSITPAMALTEGGVENDLSLEFRHTEAGKFEYNIAPNPFLKQTILSVSLPKAQTILFTLYNAVGQVVGSKTLQLSAGNHSIPVDCPSCRETQMLHYQIQVGEERRTGKLLYQN